MAGKGPLNYTTKIGVEKTALECVTMLMRFGAKNVALSVGEGGVPDGLDFTIDLPWGRRQYAMPISAEATQKVLAKAYQRGLIDRRFTAAEHAVRVAWRVLRDWLDVQLAFIESGTVEFAQIMLPYMRVEPGKTLYSAWVENEQRSLEAGA